jgi:8-amino-7-oxononanoate synthase
LKPQYIRKGIDRVIEIEGKSFLYFSGTSYLGIGQNVEFLEVLAKNLFDLGANHGQSRVNNIRLKIFDEFEEFFAQEAKAPKSAVLSSGYLAGIAATQHLAELAEEIWIAPNTHAAVIPNGYFSGTQLNFNQWKLACQEQASELFGKRILLIGNAVDPLLGEIHDYSWVKDLAEKNSISLLIDDSHAFGVLGRGVFGTYAQWQNPAIKLVVSGSLGKALALPAGIILGNEEIIDAIKSTPLYGGASPGSPAHLHTFMETQSIYEKSKSQLQDYCGIFTQEISGFKGIKGSRNFPAFKIEKVDWVSKLENAGIIISSFPYPTQSSPHINRIVISAFHEFDDLFYLVNTLYQLQKE